MQYFGLQALISYFNYSTRLAPKITFNYVFKSMCFVIVLRVQIKNIVIKLSLSLAVLSGRSIRLAQLKKRRVVNQKNLILQATTHAVPKINCG